MRRKNVAHGRKCHELVTQGGGSPVFPRPPPPSRFNLLELTFRLLQGRWERRAPRGRYTARYTLRKKSSWFNAIFLAPMQFWSTLWWCNYCFHTTQKMRLFKKNCIELRFFFKLKHVLFCAEIILNCRHNFLGLRIGFPGWYTSALQEISPRAKR